MTIKTEDSKAWAAHEKLRAQMLRQKYGPLYGDSNYGIGRHA